MGGLVPLSHLDTPMVIESKCMSLSQIQKELWPYWNSVLEIIRGHGPTCTSGYADGHRVQIYVSTTNTEGVNGNFNDFMKWRRPYWI